MVSLYRLLPREGISIRGLTNETSFHLAKLTCALLLFASSWIASMPPIAAWTLCIVGYAIVTVSVAALVAEADWESRVNFALGLILLVAPWVLGFAHDGIPTLLHLSGGAAVAVLSGIALLTARDDPPWRFGPSAARRTDNLDPIEPRMMLVAPGAWARNAIAEHRVGHVLRSRRGKLARRAGDHRWKTHSQSRSSTVRRRTSVCAVRTATKLNRGCGSSTSGSRSATLNSQKLRNEMPGRNSA